MIKFINNSIERYVNMITASKWAITKIELIFGLMVFSAFFTESAIIDKIPIFDSFIISGIVAIIMTILWSIISILLVKRKDKLDEMKAKEYSEMIEERRHKAEMSAYRKKINNKKKYRRKNKLSNERV